MSEVIHAPEPRYAEDREPVRIGHWIAGQRVPGGSGRTNPVYNPATGEQTGAVDLATAEEVDRAVAAAREAFPAWRALSLSRRRRKRALRDQGQRPGVPSKSPGGCRRFWTSAARPAPA